MEGVHNQIPTYTKACGCCEAAEGATSTLQARAMTELAAPVVTDDEPGSQVYRDNIRNAQRTCGTCAKCGTTLPPRAPVWREPVPFVPVYL
jgi:hypothetical protein